MIRHQPRSTRPYPLCPDTTRVLSMTAPVPPPRPRPTLNMKDMGMGGRDHGSMAGMDHGAMAAGASAAAGHGNSQSMSGMNMRDKSLVPDSVKVGVGVDAIAMSPIDQIGSASGRERVCQYV